MPEPIQPAATRDTRAPRPAAQVDATSPLVRPLPPCKRAWDEGSATPPTQGAGAGRGSSSTPHQANQG